MSKHIEKFNDMLKNFRNHDVDLNSIEDGHSKNILIGIQESLYNEKLINAARSLYVNYSPVRLFTPIMYKLYMKTKSKNNNSDNQSNKDTSSKEGLN